MLLVGVLVSTGWVVSLPWLYRSDLEPRQWAVVVGAVNLLLTIWHAAGLGLLLAAVLTRGRQSTAG